MEGVDRARREALRLAAAGLAGLGLGLLARPVGAAQAASVVIQRDTRFLSETVKVYVRDDGQAVAVAENGSLVSGPSSNHSQVIQDALDYAGKRGGGLVRLAPGEYTLDPLGQTQTPFQYTYAVWIRSSYTGLRGSPGARLVLDGEETIVVRPVDDQAPLESPVLDMLDVDASQVSYTLDHGAISILNTRGAVVTSNRVSSAEHAIHLLYMADGAVVAFNHFTQVGLQAIALDGSRRVLVYGNRIVGARAGINLQPNADIADLLGDPRPQGNAIVANFIRESNTMIALAGAAGNVVLGNVMEDSLTTTDYGVIVTSYYHANSGTYYYSEANVVSGNRFARVRQPIVLSGASGYESRGNTVVGNTCIGGGSTGLGQFILLAGAVDNVVEGNECLYAAAAGAQIVVGAAASRNLVRGNRVLGVSVSNPDNLVDGYVYSTASLPGDWAPPGSTVLAQDDAGTLYLAVKKPSGWSLIQLA